MSWVRSYMLWRGSSHPQGFLPLSTGLLLDIQGTFQHPQHEEQTPKYSGSRSHQDSSEKSRQVNCFLFIPFSKDFQKVQDKVWGLECCKVLESRIAWCLAVSPMISYKLFLHSSILREGNRVGCQLWQVRYLPWSWCCLSSVLFLSTKWRQVRGELLQLGTWLRIVCQQTWSLFCWAK